MAQLSIGRAWDEAKAVLGRDRGPITAVALALLVLPGAIAELLVPPAPPGSDPSIGRLLVSLTVVLVTLVGQLTISRIAAGQQQSVGEAIRYGLRRSPSFLLALMLWLLPFGLVASPFLLQVQANPTTPPPGALLAVLLLTLLFLLLGVRLAFTTPVAANESAGPVAILARSWRLTAGHWWRLFGFLLLYMIAALICLGAVTLIVGVVVKLIAGEPERLSVAALILALVAQIAAAIVSVLLTVLLTRLYLQVAGHAEEPVSVPHAP